MGVVIKNCASFIILLQVHTLGILYRDENEVLPLVTTWKNLINKAIESPSKLLNSAAVMQRQLQITCKQTVFLCTNKMLFTKTDNGLDMAYEQ